MSVTSNYIVTGMTCGHCAASVREEVSELAGVENVDVTVESGVVVITSANDLDRDQVSAAVAEAGYQLA